MSPAQKIDVSKRPTVIGAIQSDTVSPPGAAKPRSRKPSTKASDSPLESLTAIDTTCLLDPENIALSQKITSPLNSPLVVKDHLLTNSMQDPISNTSNFVGAPVVTTSLEFTTSGESVVGSGVPHFGVPRDHSTPGAVKPKDPWRPPTIAPSLPSKKNDKTSSNNTSSATSNAGGGSSTSTTTNTTAAKKRKNNKSSSASEDGKKKQKTATNQNKKSARSVANGSSSKDTPSVLPPFPFGLKSSGISSTKET